MNSTLNCNVTCKTYKLLDKCDWFIYNQEEGTGWIILSKLVHKSWELHDKTAFSTSFSRGGKGCQKGFVAKVKMSLPVELPLFSQLERDFGTLGKFPFTDNNDLQKHFVVESFFSQAAFRDARKPFASTASTIKQPVKNNYT